MRKKVIKMKGKHEAVVYQIKSLQKSLKQLKTAIKFYDKSQDKAGAHMVKERIKDVKTYYRLLMQEIGEKE